MRRVRIVGAGLTDSTGGSDAAYHLLKVEEGSVAEVAIEIAAYLATCDLTNASPGPLTLDISIEIDVGRPAPEVK